MILSVMKLTIKHLGFAVLGLLSCGIEASLPNVTNNLPYNNDQTSASPNPANHSKALNHYALSNLNESGTLVFTSQLPSNDNFVNAAQKTNYRSNDEWAIPAGFSITRSFAPINEIINEVPLPTAVWLFLGGLFSILRIQKKNNYTNGE